ncbi:unnamed protein product [Phytophthora fragariaefolia]|uniref:Unnamed protein product n=1 Tax=Phytophthora fragariaefolia TaxID=1490495 RepID=A0A9W7D6N0_9STRA|nr:unnamed protein product [Phytophthora fragariaefolia]
MLLPVQEGVLAFVGPSHVNQQTGFQYVEVISLPDTSAVVKIVGPDDREQDTMFEVPKNIVRFRLVSNSERKFWPGSYLAHTVAFVQTSRAGIDEWCYGVVTGYTASDTTDTLHILNADGPTRFPLTNLQSVIKVDALNYALLPEQGVTVAALSATEILHQQDALLAAYHKKRSGIPATVTASLSPPFAPSVPVVKPASLRLVYVRRQHIVEFSTAPRVTRPADLYTDAVSTASGQVAHENANEPITTPRRRRSTARAAPQQTNLDSSDEDMDSSSDE